uniref:Uncharacterized protein n=1 Tax=Oryza brachyantha TaxID=4533 RepID=J3MI08_ORYBR
MSVWPEQTFTRLRYLLGGLRPIEIVYLRLSLGRGSNIRLKSELFQSGISLTAR